MVLKKQREKIEADLKVGHTRDLMLIRDICTTQLSISEEGSSLYQGY